MDSLIKGGKHLSKNENINESTFDDVNLSNSVFNDGNMSYVRFNDINLAAAVFTI